MILRRKKIRRCTDPNKATRAIDTTVMYVGIWLEVGNGSLVSTIGGGVAQSGIWEFGLNNRWGCGSKWDMGVWSQQ